MMNPLTRLSRAVLALALAAVLTFSALVPARAQEAGPSIRITQVDNSKFPQVTVYVSITDAAGEPMAVDPGQIQLTENGARMKVSETGGPERIGPLTTLLIMDVSGSMLQAGKLKGAKAAAKAFVQQMRPGDQAGLVTFNTEVRYVQPITSDLVVLAAAIDKLNAYEDTAMFDAIARGTEILQDIPGRKAIIVLTDGLDNVSKNTPDSVLKGIGPNGLSISTIGLGDPNKTGHNSGLDEAVLQDFSGRAGGVYSYANDPETLQGLYQLYARALQSEYSIVYQSPATLRDGANRTLSVSLSRLGTTTQVEYNPGGVLPEISTPVSWRVFATVLAGLLGLLILPQLIGLFANRRLAASPPAAEKVTPPVKKANIKLK
jgi:VWFA-related protein